MKKIKTILISCLLALASLTGCKSVFSTVDESLVGVSAKSVTYSRKTYGSTAIVKAENYINNAEKSSADHIFIDETLPIVGGVTIDIKGYERIKTPKPQEKTENPKPTDSVK